MNQRHHPQCVMPIGHNRASDAEKLCIGDTDSALRQYKHSPQMDVHKRGLTITSPRTVARKPYAETRRLDEHSHSRHTQEKAEIEQPPVSMRAAQPVCKLIRSPVMN